MEEFDWRLYLKNALSVRETGNGFLPLRFTEKQLAVYGREETRRIRSLSTAGICLDLLTDSPFLSFRYHSGSYTRNWLNFDVLVDGVWLESSGSCPIASEGTFHTTLPGGPIGQMRRVTIYLPQLAEVCLHSFEVADGARIEPAPACARRLLTLGGSITQGMDGRYPSCSYPVLLARQFDAELINQGVGGYIFQAESLDEELPYRPDVVTVAYGSCDWGRYEHIEQFRAACAEYLNKLTACFAESRIYVITPIWRADYQAPRHCGNFAEIGQTITEACSAHSQVKVIDGMGLVPHQVRFFGDGYMHPSDEGHLHYALNLSKHIQF